MPVARFQMPDGRVARFEVPEGTTPEQAHGMMTAHFADAPKSAPATAPVADEPGKLASIAAGAGKGFGDVVLGAQGYLGKGMRAVGMESAGGWLENDAAQGRAKIKGELAPYKEANPLSAGGGEIAGNIIATLPVGGALGAGAKAVGATRLGSALASAGMTTGAKVAPGMLPAAADMGIRMIGGAATGGASAALVDPDAAQTGAIVGAALPPILKVAGKAVGAIGKVLRGGGVSDEVATLASRAKELGIDIPADRLVNSRPMNALASGLNYVPFSGRAATERTMENQLNAAASRLVGENSPNMTKALRDASKNLGAKFESTLQNNIVKVDPQFMNELADAANTASRELGSDGASIISKQVDDIIAKAATGEIDGKAAYNIKKTLDRIGNRNSSEAHYARELKRSLMGALDRSLGADEAAAFAKTRQQYGNMLDLERLAKNGAEGEISVARLANMRDIGNEPMQELANIAAQFVKARESQHGAMQRGFAAVGIGGAAGLPALGATIAGGKLANSALNSNALRSFMVNGAPESVQRLGASPELNQLIYRSAPVAAASLR